MVLDPHPQGLHLADNFSGLTFIREVTVDGAVAATATACGVLSVNGTSCAAMNPFAVKELLRQVPPGAMVSLELVRPLCRTFRPDAKSS